SEGISRFCVGLAKKALLANSCAAILSNVLPETLSANSTVTVAGAWFGGLLYMLHIYLDFSAYSDMAIGLGRMTGFHYRENFNYPYIAGTVTDFWRRWHISLSTFFRDYVYIPLGGNRKGLFRQIINMFIVWGLTGLWHGASYNFVLWGLYYFVFLAIEKAVLLRLFEKFKNVFTVVIGHVYTLLVVFFGWVLFRFTDFTSMKIALRAMFGLNGNVFCNMEIVTVILNNIVFIVVCIVAATPFVKWLAGKLKKRAENDKAVYMHIYNAINLAVPVLLLFLATIALVGDSYNPFIYFRF
ncbi:MAG: MBOAT family protein, partial [Lachnospira sp.]|nr:MBOAT family protein [Lachnospira sp.]